MASLHLPKSDVYNNLPGDDRVGDYRANGVDYQPVLSVIFLPPITSAIPGTIYYDAPTATYKEVSNGQWVDVDKAAMDKILITQGVYRYAKFNIIYIFESTADFFWN